MSQVVTFKYAVGERVTGENDRAGTILSLGVDEGGVFYMVDVDDLGERKVYEDVIVGSEREVLDPPFSFAINEVVTENVTGEDALVIGRYQRVRIDNALREGYEIVRRHEDGIAWLTDRVTVEGQELAKKE